jgi:hypothetical protein
MESDPIALCRLTDIFRRKGIKLVTLAATSGPATLSLMTVVECPEDRMTHMFHFLRKTPEICRVAYYRHEESEAASFVFLSARDPSTEMTESLLPTFPGTRLIFANRGHYLLEIPGKRRLRKTLRGISGGTFLSFAHVETSSMHPVS